MTVHANLSTPRGGVTFAPRGVVLSNLLGTPAQPMRGIFNSQQFAHLSRIHDLMLIVPEPFRWPPLRPPREYELKAFPGTHATLLPVWHPPVVGRLVNAAFLYAHLRLQMLRRIYSWRPDFVLGSFAFPDGVAAVLLAKQLGIPAFIKVHGSDVNVMASDPFIRAQMRWAFRRARGIVSVSQALLDKMVSRGLDAESHCLVYNGIDRDRFKPMERSWARKALGLEAEGRSILYVGNLKRDKGVIDLLQAFEMLAGLHPDVSLYFVGDGAMRQDIEERTRQTGLTGRVKVCGARPHAEISTWMGSCDVLCLPSHAEGVPNVVVEAQACGRPVVATRVGGTAEVLKDAGGLLVEASDPAALAVALGRVLGQAWIPAQVASSCRVGDWEDSARQLSEFIRSRLSDGVRVS